LHHPRLPAAGGPLEDPAGALLQRQPRALAFPGMGRRVGDLAREHSQSIGPPPLGLEPGQHRVVIGRMDEFRPAVLADPDARLRALDAAAADALPRCHALGHL
jgi:hypothetical protein